MFENYPYLSCFYQCASVLKTCLDFNSRLRLSKIISLSELVGDIKRDSSKWIKTKGEKYRKFQWQDGYGAFSVGYTQLEDVKTYIAKQKIHHTKQNFEDELRYFLNKYEVEFDEKYIWD